MARIKGRKARLTKDEKKELLDKLIKQKGKYRATRIPKVKIMISKGVKPMESVIAVPRNEMIILDGSKIDEFIERSKTGASKRMMEKLAILEAKRKGK